MPATLTKHSGRKRARGPARSTGTVRARRRPGLAVLLLVTLSVLPYLNSLWGEFHFDDEGQVVGNDNLAGLATTLANCPRARMLTFITFHLNARIHGFGWMPGWHLVNIALHAGCVMALYWLLTLLAGSARDARTVRYAPLLGAALLAVHPLASEPVNYIQARSVTLCALFVILAICGTVLALQRESRRARIGGLALAVGAVALASISREVGLFWGIAGPLLYLFVFSQPRRPARRWFAAAVAAAAGLAATWLAAAGLLEPVLRRLGADFFWSHLWAQTTVFWRYLLRTVLPLPGWLSVDHYVPTHEFRLLDTAVLLATIGLLGVIALALMLKRAGGGGPRTAAFLLLLIPAMLAPYFMLPSLEMMVEYRFYLPLAAACGLGGLALEQLFRGRRLRVAVPALLVVLASLTAYRNLAWRTDVSLWEDALAKAPRKARTANGLAWALLKPGPARDPKRALELALQSFDRTRFDVPPGFNPYMVDTLAEALHANGMCARAAELESEIIKRGWSDPMFKRQLAKFESGIEIRGTPIGNPGVRVEAEYRAGTRGQAPQTADP